MKIGDKVKIRFSIDGVDPKYFGATGVIEKELGDEYLVRLDDTNLSDVCVCVLEYMLEVFS